ncbi:SH3-domain-containing protein [Panus rudis PR-1116 ss-1]|nr:SH3-domain-containing protein [Panus rudis PR-1116 ss-1]
MGRVAAAAAALRSQNSPIPRPPPLRDSSQVTAEEGEQPDIHHERHAHVTSGHLEQQKKFGDVDMSSAKNMFSSLRHSTANKHATPPPAAPPTPAAFSRKRNEFAPPPQRHISATSSTTSLKSPESISPPPPPARARAPEPEPEEEPQGEWAEALYEYTSDDPGDLILAEGDRVLVIEKPSDDWWKGESNGKQGLFPAAYVKLL